MNTKSKIKQLKQKVYELEASLSREQNRITAYKKEIKILKGEHTLDNVVEALYDAKREEMYFSYY